MLIKSLSFLTKKSLKITKSFTKLCLSVFITVTFSKALAISSKDGHDGIVNGGCVQGPLPILYSLPAG